MHLSIGKNSSSIHDSVIEIKLALLGIQLQISLSLQSWKGDCHTFVLRQVPNAWQTLNSFLLMGIMGAILGATAVEKPKGEEFSSHYPLLARRRIMDKN